MLCWYKKRGLALEKGFESDCYECIYKETNCSALKRKLSCMENMLDFYFAFFQILKKKNLLYLILYYLSYYLWPFSNVWFFLQKVICYCLHEIHSVTYAFLWASKTAWHFTWRKDLNDCISQRLKDNYKTVLPDKRIFAWLLAFLIDFWIS